MTTACHVLELFQILIQTDRALKRTKLYIVGLDYIDIKMISNRNEFHCRFDDDDDDKRMKSRIWRNDSTADIGIPVYDW